MAGLRVLFKQNLHYTAKYIQNNFNGVFPDDYNSLLKLKNSPYTAAAITLSVLTKKEQLLMEMSIEF